MSGLNEKVQFFKSWCVINQETIVASLIIITMGIIVSYLINPNLTLAIICFIPNSISYWIDKLWKASNNPSIAAFLGAASATIGIGIINNIERQRNKEKEEEQRILERNKKHYNALVHIEYSSNFLANDIADNLYVLEGLLEKLKELKNEQPSGYYSHFQQFEINIKVLEDLLDIYLINKIFDFNADLKKLNYDLEHMNDLLIKKELKIENDCINAKEYGSENKGYFLEKGTITENLLYLKNKLKNIQNVNMEILADTRILLRRNTIKPEILNKDKITEEEREKELIIVREEVNKNIEKSKRENDKIKENIRNL